MIDLAHGFDKPSVLDLKIGRIMHDPNATQEKIKRAKIKYPNVELIGFQISGMRVVNK